MTPPPAIHMQKFLRVMIAAVVVLGQVALGIDGAPEFAAPDDERIFQHAALFQILDQAGGGLIHIAALERESLAADCRADPSRDAGFARRARRARRAGARGARWRRRCRASSHRGRTAPAWPGLRRRDRSGRAREPCMRKAISYCAMRVWISGSPKRWKFASFN